MQLLKKLFLLYIAVITSQNVLSQTTVSCDPIADTYIASGIPNQNYGSETTIAIGIHTEILAFIKFDISAIPTGSTINSAKLRLYVSSLVDNSDVVVGRAKNLWNETNVTWNNNSTTWELPYVQSRPQGVSQWWEIDVTSIVKKWIEEDLYNYGFYLEKANSGIVMFYSRESSNKPQLVVSYAIPSGIHEKDYIPKIFILSQNYPNPFNPETTIKYYLPKASPISLIIYNILGQEIKTLVNEIKPAGYYEIIWNGTNNNGINVSSDIYLYRLLAGEYVRTKKMILIR